MFWAFFNFHLVEINLRVKQAKKEREKNYYFGNKKLQVRGR